MNKQTKAAKGPEKEKVEKNLLPSGIESEPLAWKAGVMSTLPSNLYDRQLKLINQNIDAFFIAVLKNSGPSRELERKALGWGIWTYLIL